MNSQAGIKSQRRALVCFRNVSAASTGETQIYLASDTGRYAKGGLRRWIWWLLEKPVRKMQIWELG